MVNVLLFPDPPLCQGHIFIFSDMIGHGNQCQTLTLYSVMAALIQNQLIALILGLEGLVNMIEQWLVLMDAILSPQEKFCCIKYHCYFLGVRGGQIMPLSAGITSERNSGGTHSKFSY